MPDSMNRRDFMTIAAAMLAALPACRLHSETPRPVPLNGLRISSSAKRPNILLIMTDQERFDLPKPAGYVLPNHERLQAKGVSFRKYHAATAPCTPSRATIFTGQHIPHTHMFDNLLFPYVSNLAPAVPTLGTMMRAAGWYTVYKGKWHLSRFKDEGKADEGQGVAPVTFERALEPYGFSEYNPTGDFHGVAWTGHLHDAEIAGSASTWLRQRAKDVAAQQPWFMTVCMVNPHDVMFADNDPVLNHPKKNAGPFDVKRPPPDPIYAKDWQAELPRSFLKGDPAKLPSSHREYARFMDMFFGSMPLDQPDQWRTNQNYYLNCLQEVDRHIGEVLDALEASGQASNTIIIFSSDHGEMGGAHNMRQKGPLIYKENLNVPLVIVHPDIKGGVTTDVLASAVDLAPTLLGLAGIPGNLRATSLPDLVGHDLSEVLAAPGRPGARDQKAGGLLMTYDALNSVDAGFTCELARLQDEGRKALSFPLVPNLRPDFTKKGFLRGVYDGRYRFARYFAPTGYNRPKTLEALLKDNELELYDTQSDPDEVDNLAADVEKNSAQILAMNDKLERLIQSEIGDDKTMSLPPIPRLRARRIEQ